MQNRNRVQILTVGTDLKAMGGIASVLKSHYASDLPRDWEMFHLVTHRDTSAIGKLAIFMHAVITLFGYFKRDEVDILHIHTASRASFFRKSILTIIAQLFKRKVILHLHGAEFLSFYHDECGIIRKWWIRRTFHSCDRLIVLSNIWVKDILAFAPNTNIVAIHNPVKLVPRHTLNSLTRESNTILFLGRIGKRKGVWDILTALPSVLKECHNTQILLGGDGETDEAKQRIEDMNLEKSVRLLGWMGPEEKEALLAKSAIYILPSYNEGLPMGLLEAMSWEMPCISTPVGGIPDIITHEDNGLLVPVSDTLLLSQALIRLLKNENLRSKLGKSARITVENEACIQVITPKLNALYKILHDLSVFSHG